MRTITLNTWGTYGPYRERWSFLLDELFRLNPDLLCLQEVASPILLEEIRKRIGLSHSFSSPEAGLSVASRYPSFSERVLKFRATSPSERDDRRALIIGFTVGKEKVIVANTHLSWKTEDECMRLEQTLELIFDLKGIEAPSILAGDFNDIPESRAIQEIKKAGYVNLSDVLHSNERVITWDNRNPYIQTHSVKFPDRQIDFLFLDRTLFGRARLNLCKVVFNRSNAQGVFPSDHYGLLADLDF